MDLQHNLLGNQYTIRNICIGLIDGLTIPLALATGLSGLVGTASTIVIACIVASFAGAITMSIGGYTEAKKYEPSKPSFMPALTIGFSYFAGGCIVAAPYLLVPDIYTALVWSISLSLVLLLIAGYLEAFVHGGAAWLGAIRVVLTGAIAAGAAYLVAKLFT